MISPTALTVNKYYVVFITLQRPNGSLERVLKTKLKVRGNNLTNKITDMKLTGVQSAVTSYSTTYTRTHVGILNST
jgi:hypothetical protein